MPSCLHRTAQTAKVNWDPWSKVSWAGRPCLEINPAMRVAAQVAAAMSFIGNASSQGEDLSPMVNKYLLLQVAARDPQCLHEGG